MKKWRNLRNAENGRYKLSVIVLAVLLAASLLWQGVFAMLGTTDASVDAFAMLEAFGADVGDGLQDQRAAAWLDAVENPAASGGVWGQFWENAQFGAAGAVSGALPVPTIPQVENVFAYNNVIWRVLHRHGSAALVITEHVFGWGTPYNTTGGYTRLSNSYLRGALDAWAQDNLGTLRQRALTPIGVDDDVFSDPSLQWSHAQNAAAGRTSPGERTNSDSAVFVLSMSEANQHFVSEGVNGNTEENNRARRGRPVTTAGHFSWWLRSPGNSSSLSLSYVRATGHLATNFANNPHIGFRPALWIQI